MPDQVYFAASKEALKLKGVQDPGIKKKKKKKKSRKHDGEMPIVGSSSAGSVAEELSAAAASSSGAAARGVMLRTKAEIHFMERQRQREEHRIKKKASKSHKEKVELFNRNLDSQSEHFDIPKVSWTK